MEKLNEISLDETKRIQMDVLTAIHEFCLDNNINYSIACGTLLGAARHKGYIPWDDDIDIYLLREDYERLLSSFPKIYKKKYCIASISREKKWDRPYAKAYDTSTIFIEPGCSFPLGVNIDIFPIDDVPDNNKEWLKFDKVRRKIQNIYNFKFTQICSRRKLYKNIIIVICLSGLSIFSKRKIAKFIDKFIRKYNNKNYSKCFESCQGIYIKKPIEKILFKSLSLYPFEDRFFYGFEDYDSYLTSAYGNWRLLPPLEKRKSHHINKSYWKD